MRVEYTTKEVKVPVYIADDETPFAEEWQCEQHERDKRIDELNDLIHKLLVICSDSHNPCDGGYYPDKFYNCWYRVKTIEEIGYLNELYHTDVVVDNLPEYVNLNFHSDGEVYDWRTLTDCMNYVKEFFGGRLGIDVDFKKREGE